MKVVFLKKVLVIFVCFYFPLQTMAWGVIGHRVVCEIAESYLKPNTRSEIKKILGTESLAIASTWADFIRSESSYNYLSAWHYINFERGLSQIQLHNRLKADTSTNAYTKANLLIKELKNKDLIRNKKQLYLRMLIHLIGDIHQPLHVGNRADKGGNDIKVIWFDKSSDLHTIWDSELISFQQLSYTEYARAINFSSGEQRASWIEGGLSSWLFESYELADVIYASAKPGDILGFRYNYDHVSVVNQQLVKAGVRLAELLNYIFSS